MSIPHSEHGPLEVPDHLVQEIERGNCVAFLGAGFSAAAGLPGWLALIGALAEFARQGETRDWLHALLDRRPSDPKPSAAELDRAAQLLEDDLGRDRFIEILRQKLAIPAGTHPSEVMGLRQERVAQIPFRAIVTTNFDPLLPGSTLSPSMYHQTLRGAEWGWWSESFWGDRRPHRGAPVVKLHGAIESENARSNVILTRRDYQRLLYREPGYQTFVRALLASRTLLFLGFSFTDNYLNELRAEVLALFADPDQLHWDARGGPPDERVLGYALLSGLPAAEVRHYRRHEGIHVLNYSDAHNHAEFDDWLGRLWKRTALRPRLRHRLAGQRVLWVDAHHAENNPQGIAFLEDVLTPDTPDTPNTPGAAAGQASNLRTVKTAADALALLDTFAPNLILTHWGSGAATEPGFGSAAEQLLSGLRRRERGAPVIVFTWNSDDADQRRRICWGLGAFDFCVRWDTLFLAMERLFAPLADDTAAGLLPPPP